MSDQMNETQLKNLKSQLEQVAGKHLDLDMDRLINFTYPVAVHNYDDGQVTFHHVFLPGKTCSSARLLDVGGSSSTNDDGIRTFLLSEFICSPQNLFTAPVNVVATPRSNTPCYVTTTSTLVPDRSWPGFFSDVNITLFTWLPDGAPASNISVDWRCRLPVAEIILR